MNRFHGTGVALVTPFNTDGSVDYDGLEKQNNYQVDGKVQNLLSKDTTGELATQKKKEKEFVLRVI